MTPRSFSSKRSFKFLLRPKPDVLLVVDIDDVPPRLPRHLLAPCPDLVVVEAHPQSEGLGHLAVQVEEVLEESVVKDAHLAVLCVSQDDLLGTEFCILTPNPSYRLVIV